eukprot:TRINITY_DN702_c0_g1_i1.p1 TRINITY_DN702_c0_g1~~TRINITY_DN702_c0_g1_i1.p1  ORF type:complete len:176 (+),score=28.81 TRINITY_DN702_c0_g1_i1:45-572(+)
MRILLFLLLLLAFFGLSGSTLPDEKISPSTKAYIEKKTPFEGGNFWIFFDKKPVVQQEQNQQQQNQKKGLKTKKGEEQFSYKKHWQRKSLKTERLVQDYDNPIAQNYIDAVLSTGAKHGKTSKWLNAISVSVDSLEQLRAILDFEFVSKVELVRKGKKELLQEKLKKAKGNDVIG